MSASHKWSPMRLLSARTITTKLACSLALAAVGPVIAVGLLFIVVNSRLAVQAMEKNLSALADVMGANSGAALAFDDAKAAQETLASLNRDPSIVAACVYGKKGEVFAAYRAAGEETQIPPRPGSDGLQMTGGFVTICKGIDEGRGRTGTLFLKARADQLQQSIRRSTTIVGEVLAMSLGLVCLLARLLHVTVAHPIQELSAAAQSISSRRDYSVRVQKHSNDELGMLCECFNNMLEQIQRHRNELQSH